VRIVAESLGSVNVSVRLADGSRYVPEAPSRGMHGLGSGAAGAALRHPERLSIVPNHHRKTPRTLANQAHPLSGGGEGYGIRQYAAVAGLAKPPELRACSVRVYRRDVKVIREPAVPFAAKSAAARQGSAKISSLSTKSARACMFYLSNVDCLTVPGESRLTVLTYPAEFPLSGRVVKEHVRQFCQHLTRAGLRWWWGLEFQPKRGAPHINVLTDKALPADWAEIWYRIVGSGDVRHLHVHQHHKASEVVKGDGVAMYCAWYLGKKAQKDAPAWFVDVGRFWGHRRDVKPVMVGEIAGSLVQIAPVVRAVRSGINAARREASSVRARWMAIFKAYSGDEGAAGEEILYANEEGERLMPVRTFCAMAKRKAVDGRPVKRFVDRGRSSLTLYQGATFARAYLPDEATGIERGHSNPPALPLGGLSAPDGT